MKAGCFFISISWRDGAVFRQFRTVSDELVRRGHRVVILVDHQRKDVEDHTGNPAIYTWPSRRPVRLADAVFLRRLIKRYGPDCLIASFGATNVMQVVGRLKRVHCRVAWYQTLSSAVDLDVRIPSWKLRLLRFRKRRVYQLATHIVSNCDAGLRDIQKMYGVPESKCHLLYNAMPDPYEGEDALQAPARRAGTVVCAGQLATWKGQDILIRSLSLLKNALPDARVEFVGGGSQETYSELSRSLGIEGRCEFVGSVSHREVIARMASSVTTVVPSRGDCAPWVVLESLSVGTPVIASRVGGIPEIIRDGVDGFLVPPDDPEALAEKLKLLLSDANLRESMGRNARKRFLDMFELNKNMERQVAWFEDTVDSALG